MSHQNIPKYLSIIILLVHLCSGGPLLLEENNSAENVSSTITVADLGVDYLDGIVPDYLKNTLANISLTIDTASNTYGSQAGTRLRTAVAKYYSKLINQELDQQENVVITVGATEAIFSALMGLSTNNDEWIIIEPFYQVFRTQVELLKIVPKYTTLKSSKTTGNSSAADWELNYTELENLINNRTKGIIFNNPNNPLGKCYNRSEIEFIADLAKRHDLIILSDEVHEFTTDSMIRLASIPGMFERTLTIGSASKAFNLPGWRIGWIFGPANLIELVNNVHGTALSSASAPQQEAVSAIIEDEIENSATTNSNNSFLAQNLINAKRKRNFIVQATRNAGMTPIVPEGGYCLLTSWPSLNNSDVQLNQYAGNDKGDQFASWMREVIGVNGFTGSRYYSQQHRPLGFEYLRFCYQKSDETLQRAADNLLQLRKFEKA